MFLRSSIGGIIRISKQKHGKSKLFNRRRRLVSASAGSASVPESDAGWKSTDNNT